MRIPEYEWVRLQNWSGGAWRPSAPPFVAGVSIDTRTVRPGNMYVALRGARCDGHDFVRNAFAAGAAAAMVSRAYADSLGDSFPGPLLCVDDTLRALGAIAAGWRRALDAVFIGVTGSVGKTTVKEMIADVLQTKGATSRSCGNWNNEIGLPLSLLRMLPEHRFGVYELGMNHHGELAPLCEMLQPSWGVITNVGPVHIEFFDSVDDIAREKASVFRCLPAEGTAVVDRDDARWELLRDFAVCRVVTVSTATDADYRGFETTHGRCLVAERATGETCELEMPIPGSHVLKDALFAVAVGRAHGAAWDDISRALRDFRPQSMRWNVGDVDGIRFVNDAYNANPMSMRASISGMKQLSTPGGKWLVLGGMLELGESTDREHRELGAEIASGEWAGLVVVGKLGALIADGAVSGGMGRERVLECSDHAQAAAELKERLKPGDVVLLKGSRSEKMENVLENFRAGGVA